MTDPLKSSPVLSLWAVSPPDFAVHFVMMATPKSTHVLSLRRSWQTPRNQAPYCHYTGFSEESAKLILSWRTPSNRPSYCHYTFHDRTPEIKPRTVITKTSVVDVWDRSCHDRPPEIDPRTVITLFMIDSPKSTHVLSLHPTTTLNCDILTV